MLISLFITTFSRAEEYEVFGRPLNVYGYLIQDAEINLKNEKGNYDAQRGLQAALMQLLIETNYKPTDNLKLTASGKLIVDWAYQLNSHNSEWNDKQFSKSKSAMNVDDHYWQILNEAHVTWTPGPFLFRVGKQVVQWGEAVGVTLLNQINPVDNRRAFGQIDMETQAIPIWLIRAEYFPRIQSSWLQDLGFEFVFNPNADFIPNQGPPYNAGNDNGGIWGPNLIIDKNFAGPGVPLRAGSSDYAYITPERWNHEGYEYGLRVKANISDTIMTLSYFYGLDKNGAATTPVPAYLTTGYDGSYIAHATSTVTYPLMRFVGFTLLKDLTFLKAKSLGSVTPIVWLESFYGFQNTFGSLSDGGLFQSDEFRVAVGATWKVELPWLNPYSGFTIMPSWYMQRLLDRPDGGFGAYDQYQNNYVTTLNVSSDFLSSRKLNLSVMWLQDWTNHAYIINPNIDYSYDQKWKFSLGLGYLDGSKEGLMYQMFNNKSNIYFKVAYKWG